jgi:hypothetical protein
MRNVLEPENAVAICLALGNAAKGASDILSYFPLKREEINKALAESLSKVDPKATQKIDQIKKMATKNLGMIDVVEKAQTKLASEMWDLAQSWSENIAKETK